MHIWHWYSISTKHYEPDLADLECDEFQDPYLHDMLRQLQS